MQKIGVGRTAEIFDYGNGKVLKLFYEGVSEETINTEYVNNRIIESLKIPTAKCYEVITYNNRKGLVIEKLTGFSMMKAMEMNPMKSMSFAVPLAKTHYQMHKPINERIQNNKEQLQTKISNVGILSNMVKAKLYAYIESLNNGNILCHSDYHPENVFISDDRYVVFDWSTATVGNKYSDVAHTNLLLRYGVSPDTKNPIELFITNKVRNSFADKYLEEYINQANCTEADIRQWEIPHMASMLNDVMSEKIEKYFVKKIESFIKKEI
jgi:thiamine kinase-like enzyme